MESIDHIYIWIINNGIKLIGAIIFLIIGFWLARIIIRSLSNLMTKRGVDPAIISFFRGFGNIVLKILVIISVMGMVGIEITSFIALLGAIGIAIGLAFQGALSNLAGGVMILIFKPFKIKHYIEVLSYAGTVVEIQIFNTLLKTADNKIIIIPNSSLISATIVNFSKLNARRVEWIFDAAYGTDFSYIKETITEILNSDERILKQPAIFIGLAEMSESSIKIKTRAWVKGSDFWNVFFDINEKAYKTFNDKGIDIPFPQIDLNIKQQNISIK